MTKIDIISGFLGAGKTTLIRKLISEAFVGEQVVLIENEFGEIGIDGGFLKEAGIQIREMNSGCICCSLVGDFGESLKEVMKSYQPDRILIEPSGVGKLSDVIRAVEGVQKEIGAELNSCTTVVDVMKCRIYSKNFGEFFSNQIQYAGTVILSRTDKAPGEKVEQAVEYIRSQNEKAKLITTPADSLDGKKILEVMEAGRTLEEELMAEMACPECGGYHEHGRECHHNHDHSEHNHDHDDHCHDDHDHHDHEHGHDGHDHDGHGHDDYEHEHCHDEHGHDGHKHGHDEHDHDHHDHEHGHDEHDHDHHEHDHHGHDHHDHDHHDHEHGESCGCGHHHGHDHEGHHHADEVFTSWGRETVRKYTVEEMETILSSLEDDSSYGNILRAKGMVSGSEGQWIYFDMVPQEHEVRFGEPEYTGRICVIGAELNEEKLAELFGL